MSGSNTRQMSDRRENREEVSGGRYRRNSGEMLVSPVVSARARQAAVERQLEIDAVRQL